MIDRQHGKPVFSCDECGDVFETHHTEFSEIWASAKLDGWTARKIGRDYIHKCGACAVK